MAVNVTIELGYEFAVKAPAGTVFAVLADVPLSASHFPKVQRLVDLGDNVYRCEMERIGIGQVSVQTIYASRYVADKAKGSVTWTPVEGGGNALVSGSWKITDRKQSTGLLLRIHGELALPLPSLMKSVVAPVVEAEFEKMVDHFIDNLTRRFGGEVA